MTDQLWVTMIDLFVVFYDMVSEVTKHYKDDPDKLLICKKYKTQRTVLNMMINAMNGKEKTIDYVTRTISDTIYKFSQEIDCKFATLGRDTVLLTPKQQHCLSLDARVYVPTISTLTMLTAELHVEDADKQIEYLQAQLTASQQEIASLRAELATTKKATKFDRDF